MAHIAERPSFIYPAPPFKSNVLPYRASDKLCRGNRDWLHRRAKEKGRPKFNQSLSGWDNGLSNRLFGNDGNMVVIKHMGWGRKEQQANPLPLPLTVAASTSI